MRRPNIILMLSDDSGWGDLSCKGNTNIRTPNLDRLAREGADFDWFYVTPLCAPTRAEVLTGRWFPRTGVKGVSRRAECLNLDERTIGDVFRDAGYRTGYFGKWHSGSAYPYHPNGRGFEEFTGFCCGHWSHYFDSTLEHNGEEFKADGFITDVLTNRAIRYIEEQSRAEEPFLCYLAFNVPHSPFQVPDEWFDRVKDRPITMRNRTPEEEEIDKTRAVLAMCENLDWNVGRVMDAVANAGIEGETIIIYLTDNGPNTARWNGGMRGRKGSVDEGGVRTMCFMRWVGTIAAGLKIDRIAGAVDLLPTLADLSGIGLSPGQPPQEKPLDGVSLKPLLLQQPGGDTWPDRMIYHRSPDGKRASVRTQQYRAGGHEDGLFEMGSDIGQDTNLATARPDEHTRLITALREWQEEMNDYYSESDDDRPLPVGYPEFPVTYLAAQDGLPEGEITWSSIHPNASFFINWRNPADGIEWEIDVHTAGVYAVTVMYTCPVGEESATVHAEFGGSKTSGRISEPFESTLKDNEDRIPRSESYEKEFRPLELGRIDLATGRGRFRLSAEHTPGKTVMDLRAVKLERMS